MEKQVLKDTLSCWVAMDTWHTEHPCDDKRFNQSLQLALNQLGHPASVDIIRSAINELVNELHPNFDVDEATRVIKLYSTKAEAIGTYLADTNQL